MPIVNKQQYLQFRNDGAIGNIIHEVYVEGCSREGISPMHPSTFLSYFQMWPWRAIVEEKILQFYDIKYEILEVSFNDKVIKYI